MQVFLVPPLAGSLASLIRWAPATTAIVMVDTAPVHRPVTFDQSVIVTWVRDIASQDVRDCADTHTQANHDIYRTVEN